MLTQTRLKELLHYCPITGVFTWKVARRGAALAGSVAGCVTSSGYRGISVDSVVFRASHLAWLYVYGRLPDSFIDHIDTNPTNDKINNLREATIAENNQNVVRARKNNLTGLLGVGWHEKDGMWRARITLNGVQMFLGNFNTKEAAHQAYVSAKKQLHTFSTL